MRRQLPPPGAWVCFVKLREREDEPRLAAGALDRQARQSTESYLHASMPAPTRYSRTRCPPWRTVGRVPGVVRLFRRPHLASPRLLAIPHSPWPSLANQSRLSPSHKLRGASRSPFCLIDVPYAVVSVMRSPTELVRHPPYLSVPARSGGQTST